MDSDPAGVSSHNLDDHDPLVGFRCCVQAIYRFGNDLHGSIESERVIGPRQIVIDGLWHTDDWIAFLLEELAGDAQRVFTANGHKTVQAKLLPICFKFL